MSFYLWDNRAHVIEIALRAQQVFIHDKAVELVEFSAAGIRKTYPGDMYFNGDCWCVPLEFSEIDRINRSDGFVQVRVKFIDGTVVGERFDVSDVLPNGYMMTFPRVLKQDARYNVFAGIASKWLAAVVSDIELVSIYTLIDRLPEAILDILAYDFKVDWWEDSYTVEQKRMTLKESFLVHKHLGTKFAVERAISAIFPNTTVEEWFEYGGEPYSFRLLINVDDVTDTGNERYSRVIELAQYYKNLRSHLDQVKYAVSPGPVWATCGGGMAGIYIRMTATAIISNKEDDL